MNARDLHGKTATIPRGSLIRSDPSSGHPGRRSRKPLRGTITSYGIRGVTREIGVEVHGSTFYANLADCEVAS
jgi:hypothetical protein